MSEEIIGSKLKAKNGYGQNGAQNASSDLPGGKTTSGFLPQGSVPSGDWQTRHVSAEQKVATAHGHKNPNANPVKIPGAK